MTEKQLIKLRSKLPGKWDTILSVKTGFSSMYIRMIITGKRNPNTDNAKKILRLAAELAEQHKTETAEIKTLINNL